MVAISLSVVTVFLALFVCVMNRPRQRFVGELPVPSDVVRALISDGKKIPAIRAYREQSAASLLEASRVFDYYVI